MGGKMSRTVVITVSQGEDVKRFKVSVNGLRRGVEYSTAIHANSEATKLKDVYYPQAKLYLMKE